MSRNRFIVCYDVRDPARLRRTHQAMLGYGDPLQYSVFLCELSRAERVLMELTLRRVAELREDSVIVVDLGPARGVAAKRIVQLGRGRVPRPERGVIV